MAMPFAIGHVRSVGLSTWMVCHLDGGMLPGTTLDDGAPEVFIQVCLAHPLNSRAYGCQPKNHGKPPQIINFNGVFHYKTSILGYHYFWKHPYGVYMPC